MKYSGITADSRKVRPGYLYAAIRGTQLDGHSFIERAVEAGAVAVLCETLPEKKHPHVEYIQVADSKKEFNTLLRKFYGEPDRKLKLAGVTGTNGKTTSVYLIQDFLNRSGISCGMLSTVEFRTPKSAVPATHTTPDGENFYRLLAQCVSEEGKALAMELSSHALDQKRVDGVKFDVAIFTNLTGDHLDYHHDFESYFNAKKRLFTELLEGTAVINIDDPYGRRLAEELTQVITFGVSPDADCRITAPELSSGKSCCILKYKRDSYHLETTMPGMHNLHNLTGAMLTAEIMGAERETLLTLAKSPCPVPGRLEKLVMPNGAVFMVDYAHTDDALKQVLTALRPLTSGRLICVFGCGGNRDRTKRPRMGHTVEELADMAVLTSDNPRFEEPMAIIEDVLSGVKHPEKFIIQPDRAEAVKTAYRQSAQGDIVLIAGKGHEDYQEINGVKHRLSDMEIIRHLAGTL